MESRELDYLTKLPNRYSFERLMKLMLADTQVTAVGHVILVDIDEFRKINQCYGYNIGDFLITALADFLKDKFQSIYTIFRMNSDGFLLVCDLPEQALLMSRTIETIIRRFEYPWHIGVHNLYSTVSVSAVQYPMNGRTIEELYRNLDSAIYKAKSSGKNNFVIYQEKIENVANKVMKHREIAKMLYDAVSESFEGFEVFFQPIYRAASEQIMGAEALLRFTNKEGTLFSPGYFVDLAERTGLIVPIGQFALRSAAFFCQEMREAGYPDFCVTINVSICQWQKLDFFDTVIRILEDVKVPFENIILEITEGMAAINIERIRDTCQGLQECGIQIALDDFGTGYSSLNMIRSLPIDLIKIDRSFVNDVVYDDYSHLFMRLITELGHELGLSVCAEGVEEPEQLARCRDMGVDYIQGFIFQKAVTREAFKALMIQ